MSRNTDILIISQCYWPEPTGSAPVVADLAEWLAEQGETVRVLTARPSYPEYRVFDAYRGGARDREHHGEVDICRVPAVPLKGGRFIGRLWHEGVLMLGMGWTLLRRREMRAAQIISVCPSLLMVLVAALMRPRGGRHLCLVHDIQSGLADRLHLGGGVFLRLLRWLEKTVLNRCDHLIALSDEMADVLRRMGVTAPITVLPPHVNTDALSPLPRPEDQPPTVLYSGNFGHKQGLDQVIDMAALLQRRAPDIRIVMRGAGNAEQALRDKAAALALDNVSIEGLADDDRLADAMAEGDVHLVPQRPEAADFAVPSKAFSIMACGRPFIATAEPGSPLDRLARESGACVIVPPGTPDAFALAVIALIDDLDRRQQMGAAGRAWVVEHAGRDAVLRRVKNLLDDDMAA